MRPYQERDASICRCSFHMEPICPRIKGCRACRTCGRGPRGWLWPGKVVRGSWARRAGQDPDAWSQAIRKTIRVISSVPSSAALMRIHRREVSRDMPSQSAAKTTATNTGNAIRARSRAISHSSQDTSGHFSRSSWSSVPHDSRPPSPGGEGGSGVIGSGWSRRQPPGFPGGWDWLSASHRAEQQVKSAGRGLSARSRSRRSRSR
jgi:hypothetical protein